MHGRSHLAVPVALALLAIPSAAVSLPLYAAREAKACAHCHLDPGGGGPRNVRGRYYESHDHTFEGFVEPPVLDVQAGPGPTPLQSLLETLSFSGNLRVLYTLAEGPHSQGGGRCESCHFPGERAPDQTFFVMQGELAVSAHISDRLTFVYSNDLGITRDAYAVLGLGESGAFVKAGVFEVPYGLEDLKDHNSLVKVRHDLGSNLRDVGAQVAIQRPRHFASLAVMNGGSRDPLSAPVLDRFDQNGSPSIALRAGLTSSSFRFGGSVMFDDSISGSRPRQLVGGVFGAAFGSRWRASGEVDMGNAKLGAADRNNLGLVAIVTVTPAEAIDLSAKIDWYDSDRDAKSDEQAWYTAIVERRLSRNASIQARYRIRSEKTLGLDKQEAEIGSDDFLTMLYVHF